MRIMMKKQGTGEMPEGLPVIDGAQVEDSTLVVNISGVSSSSGIFNVSYQWYRDEVPIGTLTSVVLGDEDVGKVFRVEMTYTNGYDTQVVLSSANTSPIINVNDAPTGTPTIIGTVEETYTVSVDVSGIADSDGLGTFSYQWLLNGSNITGAITQSYSIPIGNGGKLLSVKVLWTDGYGRSEFVTSVPVSILEAPPRISTHRFIEPTDNSQDGRFGRTTATSGNLTATSKYIPTTSQAVYIYDNTTGNFIRTIGNPDAPYSAGLNDNFGAPMVAHGAYLAVANRYYEPNATFTDIGRVYIFNITTGQIIRTIESPNVYDTPDRDYFGSSLATDGTYLIVGSSTENSANASFTGVVHQYNLVTGSKIRTYYSPNPIFGNNFGTSVAIANGRIAISDQDGAVRVYNASTGSLERTFTGFYPNSALNVHANGNYLAVADSMYNSQDGRVLIYNITTGALIRTLYNPGLYSAGASNDRFGYTVHVNGTKIAIGTPYEANESTGTNGYGIVFVYDIITGERLLDVEARDFPEPQTQGPNFGESVELLDDMLVVGVPKWDDVQSSEGAVYCIDIEWV